MSIASYDKNLVALAAYASISADGTTVVENEGCVIAKTPATTGVYTLTFDDRSGIVDLQSYIMVQPKGAIFAAAVVEDTTDLVKTVRTFDAAGAALNAAIDVLVYKSLRDNRTYT
jgi:hypothetical protein